MDHGLLRARWCALFALVLTSCASAEVRNARPEERGRIIEAFGPLLYAAHGSQIERCRVDTAVIDEPTYNVWMIGLPDAPCDLAVRVTASTLAQLTPRALQTLLAHEFGHVYRQHAMGPARAREILSARTGSGQRSVLRTSHEQFTPEEEVQADEAAAHLLTVAWRTNVGCLGTADVYEDIARDRTLWGAWLSRHPSPERRVGALVNTCVRELWRLR